MSSNGQHRTDGEGHELRRAAGDWLRQLREQRGLSQRDLAKLVGAAYYTVISQLETGRGRVPPEKYELWAKALEIDPQVLVKTLLMYYDPVTYGILFEHEKPEGVACSSTQ
jgi:transcriptional regulator with XRE-family HTH domain